MTNRYMIINRDISPFMLSDEKRRMKILHTLSVFEFNENIVNSTDDSDKVRFKLENYFEKDLRILISKLQHDDVLYSYYAQFYLWNYYKGEIFYIPKYFYSLISNLTPNLKQDYLHEFYGYLIFPQKVGDEDDTFYLGCFISFTIINSKFWICIIFEEAAEGAKYKIEFDIQDGETIEKAIQRNNEKLNSKYIISKDLHGNECLVDRENKLVNFNSGAILQAMNASINAAIYVTCAEPEFLDIPPKSKIMNPLDNHNNFGYWNKTGQKVRVINHEFHYPSRKYHKDLSIIKPFLRWQRCGPMLKNVKLVVVREHERKYKNKYSEYMKQPINNSYWVVPGQFLAGEYPRDKDPVSSRTKMADLQESGITLFIDLTHEDDWLDPYMEYLTTAQHIPFPIRDVSVPDSFELTAEILDVIDQEIARGGIVYVHCWGGVGRTGVIAGCWLARHGYAGQAALDRLHELWKECPKSKDRSSPETDEQVRYILNWKET